MGSGSGANAAGALACSAASRIFCKSDALEVAALFLAASEPRLSSLGPLPLARLLPADTHSWIRGATEVPLVGNADVAGNDRRVLRRARADFYESTLPSSGRRPIAGTRRGTRIF